MHVDIDQCLLDKSMSIRNITTTKHNGSVLHSPVLAQPFVRIPRSSVNCSNRAPILHVSESEIITKPGMGMLQSGTYLAFTIVAIACSIASQQLFCCIIIDMMILQPLPLILWEPIFEFPMHTLTHSYRHHDTLSSRSFRMLSINGRCWSSGDDAQSTHCMHRIICMIWSGQLAPLPSMQCCDTEACVAANGSR